MVWNRDVVVSNSASRLWEVEFYIGRARRLGYQRVIIDLFDGGCTDTELAQRNAHGVSLEKIQTMRARWEFLPD